MIGIVGHNIPTIQQRTCHILALRTTRIALDHLIMRLETLVGDFLNPMTFVLCESLREDRCIRNDGVMNLWEGNQIRLKLSKVNI